MLALRPPPHIGNGQRAISQNLDKYALRWNNITTVCLGGGEAHWPPSGIFKKQNSTHFILDFRMGDPLLQAQFLL